MKSELRPGALTIVRYDGASASAGERRNQGAIGADGQYLAFVPESALLPLGCLNDLVATLERNPAVGAVAPARRPGEAGGRVLAAPRGVLVVRTAAWRALSGFASEAGALDDLDFGWRLNLAGYDVLIRGDIVVPGISDDDFPADVTDFSAVAARCWGDEFLNGVLPALRIFAVNAPSSAVSAPGVVGRSAVQQLRVRSDAELRPLFAPFFGSDARWQWDVEELGAQGGDRLIAGRRRILVVTGDTLGERMAGPAIRAWEMASALAAEHDVVLAALADCSLSSGTFRAEHVSTNDLRRWEQWCDVLVFQGHLLNAHPWLVDSSKILVADIYDPIHLEALEQDRGRPATERARSLANAVETVNVQLRRADFFLCASAKQRDFWLGHLASLGRINPGTYDGDESLDDLIAIVPFGMSPDSPVHTRRAVKGVVTGIDPQDKVVLWGGGIYNWFDPLTLIRAVDVVRRTVPSVRLYFLGVKHPNPAVPAMRMAFSAQALATELGLLNTHVFFNADWVAYEDRQNYLLEADVGVSCHYSHIETAFSFRTRILDYLWASLPIVTTDGDTFGDLVTREQLGLAVPPEDVDALAAALARVLQDDAFASSCRERVAQVSVRFTWAQALAPLVEFCRTPHVARDRRQSTRLDPTAGLSRPPRSWRAEWELAQGYFAAGGIVEVAKRVRGRLFRRHPA